MKELYDRKARAMERRPAFGRGSGYARATLVDGLTCDVELEDRTLRADQPAGEGGAGSGPHPGQLMRASLGACLAMGYRLWAARLEVPIDGVEVQVQVEFDARGQAGVADVAIGWQRLRFDVVVASAAPEADVRRVVETADRLSPMLANLDPRIERSSRLTVVIPPEGASRACEGASRAREGASRE
jgi:uncharacterized OsmC-like protein